MVEYETRGVPFGRPAEVNLRNNHAQYIFTWYVILYRPNSLTSFRMLTRRSRYALAAATSVMMYLVMKKPATDVVRRVRATRTL